MIGDLLKNAPKAAQVGDLWHRVEGTPIDDGSEVYVGMELYWTTWRCTKVTPAGAWFSCMEWRHYKPRFALTSGARAISRTKAEALKRLIARKQRHIAIVRHQQVEAEETLRLAREALAEVTQ